MPLIIAGCALAIVFALVIGVGLASHLVLRHVVQTFPLWIVVILGLRRSPTVRWTALPIFLFWLVLMSLIWSYLLGISHLINGHFAPIEIVMTILVGVASISGIAAFFRWRPRLSPTARAGLFIALVVLQWACFVISFRPAFVNR